MSVIFISHSTVDKTAAQRLREQLLTLGYANVFLDNHAIIPGQKWEPVLYQRLRSCRAVVALITADFNISKWCFAEITHARALGRPIVPIVLDGSALPELLRDTQYQSAQGDPAGVLDRVRRGLEALGVRPDDSLAWDSRRPPYPGLAAFNPADAGVYFGREGDVRRILDRIHDLSVFGSAPRTLIVLGASGTGKSSLLRAGVLPRLMLDPSRWAVIGPVRPVQQPLSEIAKFLIAALPKQVGQRSVDEIIVQLKSPDGGRELFNAVAGEQGQRTVVVGVDQLEELTVNVDGDRLWLREWLALTLQLEEPRIVVIGTLRSDSVGAMESVVGWASRARYVSLAPLSETDLLRTITEPAQVAGLGIEPDLAQNVLVDVRQRQALPLLAFALRELWERRSELGLTNSAYLNELGRIDGAVRRAAENATASLLQKPAESEAVRTALLELVQISPDGNVSRRRVLRSNLPELSAPAIEKLIAARLLVVDGDFIEPAHESLFGAWKRLAIWVEEAGSALAVRAEAQEDARLWEQGERGAEYLWAEARLQRARSLLRAARVMVSPRTEDFLAASENAHKQRRRKEEEARNTEIRRLRRQRLGAGALAAAAVVAACIALLSFVRARNAQLESANSLKSSLLETARASCRDIAPGVRDVGLQALKDAAKIRPGEDLRSAYVDCLQRPGIRELGKSQQAAIPASALGSLELSDEAGGVKALLRPAGTADTFEIMTEDGGKPLANWRIAASFADSIKLSPDGSRVAIVDYPFGLTPQRLELFDTKSGRRLWSLTAETSALGSVSPSPGRISFDATGQYIAVAGIGGSVFAWDLWSYERPAVTLNVRPSAAQSLATAVSPDARWVAATFEDEALAILEMETGKDVARVSLAQDLAVPTRIANERLPLEWTAVGRIRAGTQEWQWLAPADRGFWAISNIERERSINDLAFDTQSGDLAAASEYGGAPYVGKLSSAGIDLRNPRLVADWPNSLERVVFTKNGHAVCAAELSRILCWDLSTGAKRVIAPQDFRRWNRDMASSRDDLVSAGERKSIYIDVLDTNGERLWKRKLERTSLGPLQILFDTDGQRMAYSSLTGLKVLDIVRVKDGGLIQSTKVEDPNEQLLPVFIDGAFGVLDRRDLSLRSWSDSDVLKGPLDPHAADRSNSTLSASGHLIIERSRSGAITFWDLLSSKKCTINGIASPRNNASALSASSKYFAAFDGESLKVWDTTNCQAVATVGVVEASDLLITADGTAVRYLSSGNKLITFVLATGQESALALDPVEGCYEKTGSGWSADATVVWYACLTSADKLLIRGWSANDGSRILDFTPSSPEFGGATTVSVDPLIKHIVIATEISEGGIWAWPWSQTQSTGSEPCKSSSLGTGYQLRLLENGKRAAWLERSPHSEGDGDTAATLKILDINTCAVTATELGVAAMDIIGSTPSGALVITTKEAIEAIAQDGHREWQALGAAGPIRVAALSTDGAWIAASLEDGTVVIGKPHETEPRIKLQAGPGKVTKLAVTSGESWLAAGTADGRVNLWSLAEIESELAAAGLGDGATAGAQLPSTKSTGVHHD